MVKHLVFHYIINIIYVLVFLDVLKIVFLYSKTATLLFKDFMFDDFFYAFERSL